jgi:hypothetical protein
VWEESDGLKRRKPPWHEAEERGETQEAPAHTTTKPEPLPVFKPTCSSCKNELDDDGRCDNLVCASNVKYAKDKPMPRRMGSPFQFGRPLPGKPMEMKTPPPTPNHFGSAVLEVTPTSLYDSVVIDHSAPNIYTRLFTDPQGKCDADISPYIGSGGCLPAPKMFVMDRLHCFLTPQTFYRDARREQFDRDQLMLNAMVQFTIGVRYYFQGLLAMLPKDFRAHKLAIPAQQCFYANVTISGLAPLDHDWKLMIVLDGELGMEVL